jgi:hypothetical protein
MSKLAHARAENHEFLKSTTGIAAWLRNAFMSFAMHACSWFNSEKLFEQNATTTASVKDALSHISIAPPETSESAVQVLESQRGEDDDFNVVDTTIETMTLGIDQNIISQMEVIDTPRDGSCMLWSVLAGLSSESLPAEASSGTSANISQQMAITDDQGKISDDKVLLARDVTIPELRQVISMGMIAENCQDVAAAREIEAGGLGAKHIEPCQMKHIAKHLQRDIAIITKQGDQVIAYLCTKDGKVITSQSSEFPQNKESFITALQSGPAINAQDNHARCLKYNASAQVGKQTA